MESRDRRSWMISLLCYKSPTLECGDWTRTQSSEHCCSAVRLLASRLPMRCSGPRHGRPAPRSCTPSMSAFRAMVLPCARSHDTDSGKEHSMVAPAKNLQEIELDDKMRASYLDYAMSVIVS